MQIQSIYSPNFVQKNSLATKANANSVAQNNPQYSISTLDALAFKGKYYHYKPTADDKKCMYLLDNVYENRFSDIEKRDIMFAIKNMKTDGQKSKFLSRILACTDKEGEYLDISDVELGIIALSGESLAAQNAVSSLYSSSEVTIPFLQDTKTGTISCISKTSISFSVSYSSSTSSS